MDRSTTTVETKEQDWQEELATPILWLTRGPSPKLDRASGSSFSGTYLSTVEGPDGSDSSAMSFSPADGLSGELPSITGDMTVMFGIGDGEPDVISIGSLTVSVTESAGVYSVRWNDGTNDVSVPLNWSNGGGWTLIKLTRSGTDLVVCENGSILDTYGLLSVETVGGDVGIMSAQDGNVYDIRVYDSVVSTLAFSYYHDDVVNNSGNGTLPVWE
jgi:hypothetical protein